jgi:hypothetical protein
VIIETEYSPLLTNDVSFMCADVAMNWEPYQLRPTVQNDLSYFVCQKYVEYWDPLYSRYAIAPKVIFGFYPELILLSTM